VTIIDAGRIKYSGAMHALLVKSHEHPTYRLRVGGDWPELEQRLGELEGVVRLERIDGSPEYRLAFDLSVTDTTVILRGILDMGVTIVSFAEDRRHLNEAFMDLTRGGLE
jgi:ABC-2 type transport system ATP-binding protein